MFKGVEFNEYGERPITLADSSFKEFTDNGTESDIESKIYMMRTSNKAIFEVFFDYFNFKLNNKTNVEDGVELEYFINDCTFGETIPSPAPTLMDYTFIIKYCGITCHFRFNAFQMDGTVYNQIILESMEKSTITGGELYDMLFKNAVVKSKLKGSYFTMPSGAINWDIGKIDTLTYDDIFLPKRIMDSAELYVKLFEKRGILNRVMFSGVPGTGKTELTRVLSSILNKQGVTIIKTSACEEISEKFKLAEILAPSVIIMDDIDLSLGDRNKGAYSRLLGKFLDALDGVNKVADGVGVIATTNAPHLIDLAAQRPGRFNKILLFDHITKENIKGIINKALNKVHSKFNNVTAADRNYFMDSELIHFFESEGCTGSYIYETIMATKNEFDVTDTKEDITNLVSRLKEDRKLLNKKQEERVIKSDYEKKSSGIGFGN